MHLLDAIIDPYQKLKAKRAAWHSTPIFNIQFSSYHPIPYHFYPVGIRLHLRSSTTSRQPRLGLLCSRHLQPSLRPGSEAFDGLTDLQRSGRGHSAGGAATNAAPWCSGRDPVRGRGTHLEGGWSFNFGELLETLSGRSGAGKQIYWMATVHPINLGFSS